MKKLTAQGGLLALLSALGLSPFIASAAVLVDGLNIPTDFAGGLLSTQRWQTGFGDDNDNGQFGFGSELDQLFASNDDTYLYLGITGNLQNSGNCIVVFIDVDGAATGANLLRTQILGNPIPGLPRYLAGNGGEMGFNNTQFDAGFAPDYALGWSGGSPIGSQTRTYYLLNWTDLDPVSGGFSHTNTIAGMMTSGDPVASGSPGTLGDFLSTGTLGILGASDNSNALGVEGASPPMESASAATATKGFEFAIPLSLLGVSEDDEICVFAIVSSENGYFSNEMLPTDNDPNRPTFDNLGFNHDLSSASVAAGSQYVCYTIAAPGCPNPGCETSDIEPPGGDCDVDIVDLATLLSHYGTPSGATKADGDIEPPGGDGDVDIVDLSTMLSDFGTLCQ